ncbi:MULTISPECIES: pilus assembly protein [unclassified Acidovorax]|uniref:pilus assembly protein n=1 Tax=unclassified Acidovorax TaxID=2684926 RepID=UPI000A75DCB6|nr:MULTISPECIES: pilus assembly protein [unclassified Acidovorax]
MSFYSRVRAAAQASLIHLLFSSVIAGSIAALVFLMWYPHPYGLLSGGLGLFAILITADLICGPILTLVIFNPQKPRREIITDIALVTAIQLLALGYGIHTVYQARPLFLVHEIDRFNVVGQPEYQGHEVGPSLAALPEKIRPEWFRRPIVVGIREPKDSTEKQMVMFDSLQGGRDYSQRPEFYIPYDRDYQSKVLAKAKPLAKFLTHYPDVMDEASTIAKKAGISVNECLFLPVHHRQDWIAVLDQSAKIIGFLPGDGFMVM